MSVELITKFFPFVDEIFATEAKVSLLTNNNFSWESAHSIKIYKVTTGDMFDYGRTGAPVTTGSFPSRYGEVAPLDATTETLTLRKDRSFTFEIDRLDEDETGGALSAASALARQLRNVVVPEIDGYVIAQMAHNAGNITFGGEALTASTIYPAIIAGSNALDTAEVPESGRVLIVTPDTWQIMKQAQILDGTDIGTQARLTGVIGEIDGMRVVRVPAARVPANFGFMIAHPVATTFAQKLASYVTHTNPPGISGSLVEGRIVYDAFVPENKADALYLYRTDAEYTKVTDPTGNPKEQGWYVKDGDAYVLTTDTTVQQNTDYYIKAVI